MNNHIHIGQFLREDYLLNADELSNIIECSPEKAQSVLCEETHLQYEELIKLEQHYKVSSGFFLKLANH